MKELGLGTMKELLAYVADEMIGKEQYFCELDAGLGDGDHGVTISRGWKAAKQALGGQDTLKALFQETGTAMMSSMGGAIGPIYGLLFDGFAQAVEDREKIDLSVAAAMFETGAAKISLGADVQEGQKTMYDALMPAVRSLKAAVERNASISDGFAAAWAAAEKGAEETIKMTAKKGRARFLREKSVGHKDAGAGSMSAFFEAVSDFLRAWEKEGV